MDDVFIHILHVRVCLRLMNLSVRTSLARRTFAVALFGAVALLTVGARIKISSVSVNFERLDVKLQQFQMFLHCDESHFRGEVSANAKK